MMVEYIFSINTGRSGSEYLKELFSCVNNVSSNHESEPIMNRKIMSSYLEGRSALLEANIQKKVNAINQLKGDKKLYVETNHVFIKSFGWQLPHFIPHEKIGIIILKRNKDDIVRSLTRIKCNAINNDGKGWLIHITKKNKIVPLPQSVKMPYLVYYMYRVFYRMYTFMKSRPFLFPERIFGRILLNEPELPPKINSEFLKWYVDEVNAMAAEYQRQFPEITYFTVNLNDLNDMQTVENMFSYFGISSYNKDLLGEKIGIKYNTR